MEFSEVRIFYISLDGKEWAKYLKEKLGEVNIVSHIEDLDTEYEQRDCANVVLATPALLEIQTVKHIRSMDFIHSVMVLLGVEKTELTMALEKLQYKDISNWTFFTTQQSDDSVIKLLDLIKERAKISRYDLLPPTKQCPNNYTTTPRKLHIVTSEHKEVIEVFIITNRKGSDKIDISFDEATDQHNTTAMYEEKALYRLQLSDCIDIEKDCSFVAMDGNQTCGRGTIPKLPHTKEARSNAHIHMIQEILGYKDDPMALICQMLGLFDENLRDVDVLDTNVAAKCRNFHKKQIDIRNIILDEDFKNGRWPTLLHFAADHGLILSAVELLKLPFSIDACLTVNIDDETPLQIANRHNFDELARKIKSFIKIESLKGNIPGRTDSGIVDDRRPLPPISEHEEQVPQRPASKVFQRVKHSIKKSKKKTIMISEPIMEAEMRHIVAVGDGVLRRAKSSVGTSSDRYQTKKHSSLM